MLSCNHAEHNHTWADCHHVLCLPTQLVIPVRVRLPYAEATQRSAAKYIAHAVALHHGHADNIMDCEWATELWEHLFKEEVHTWAVNPCLGRRSSAGPCNDARGTAALP